MKQRVDPIEFFFDSLSVGFFLSDTPTTPGIYEYEPVRGLGHLNFCKALARDEQPECFYHREQKRKDYLKIVFTVTSISEGRLNIDSIRVL